MDNQPRPILDDSFLYALVGEGKLPLGFINDKHPVKVCFGFYQAGLGLSGGGAAPFSPVSSSTASIKLFPKNSMTKSMGAPPLLWLWRYHLFPRTVKLSCRFQRYSFPARVSYSPCDCRKETRSAVFARSICSWV